MKIDTEKIQQYLLEIKARHREITELLLWNSMDGTAAHMKNVNFHQCPPCL
jgi:hypothetical protein